jgi:hypothetical protein
MPGPATILILAKKKAAGHGGYFDAMGDAGPAMGPMMFEMVQEEDVGDEPTPAMASTKPDLANMDFKSAAAKLREIAKQLEGSVEVHAKQAKSLKAIAGGEPEMDEEEDVEDEPSEPSGPAQVQAAPPKKGPPAFLKSKPMKY